jgi:hypothetical protein
MTSMTCWTRARARLSQRRVRAGCARPLGGEMHVGEIRLRTHLHILKTDSIHFSVVPGPALKRCCGPRMTAVTVRGCHA